MEQRERYEKPELLVIELKPEEVLAAGCKTAPTSNVGQSSGCGQGAGCVTIGS